MADAQAPVRELQRRLAALEQWKAEVPRDAQRQILRTVIDHFTYHRQEDTLEIIFRV
jgi:hypothetical protein